MNFQARIWVFLAALNGLIAVAAGAFGAHGVSDLKARELLRTGSEYELLHALAVFACILVWRMGARAAGLAAWLFLVGTALFSWSLYLMALTGQHWMGLATPVGGLFFLLGWATLALSAFTGAKSATTP